MKVFDVLILNIKVMNVEHAERKSTFNLHTHTHTLVSVQPLIRTQLDINQSDGSEVKSITQPQTAVSSLRPRPQGVYKDLSETRTRS